MEDPCKNCFDRQWCEIRAEIHFWDEDCPYLCEEYRRYQREKEKNRKESSDT